MMLQMYADGLTLTQNIRKPHPHIHVMREETMKLPMYTDGLMFTQHVQIPHPHVPVMREETTM